MEDYILGLLLVLICLLSVSPSPTIAPQQQQQQQSTDAARQLCEKSISGHGFPGIPGSNGIPGIPGLQGPQGPQGREGAKGETGEKGIAGPKGERGILGPRGKNALPGKMGVKGDQGMPGIMGSKGEKGEKGESSVTGSAADQVPQTNWKQCVWKTTDGRDRGKVKECLFMKLRSDTSLKVSFQGNMRVIGDQKCNRWYFKFNGNECSGPMSIEAVIYNDWSSGNPNLLHHRSFEGYCENIPKGLARVELWIGSCVSYTLGDAYTGWNSVSRIMIEEVSAPQS